MASAKTHKVIGAIFIVLGVISAALAVLNVGGSGLHGLLARLPGGLFKGDAMTFTLATIVLIVVGVSEVLKAKKGN